MRLNHGLSILRQKQAIPWMIPWAAGRYYHFDLTTTATGTIALSPANLYFMPLYVPNPAIPINLIGYELVVGAGAGGLSRIGLYEMIGGMRVGNKLLQTGTFAVDTTGFVSASVTYTLRQGWYFLAACITNVSAATARGISATMPVFARGAPGPTYIVANDWIFRASYLSATGTDDFVNNGFPKSFTWSEEITFVIGNTVRMLIGT